MLNLFATLWHEPRAPDAPGPLRRDWILVAALILLALTEGILSQNLVWRSLSTILIAALALTLPWRRTHPLSVVVAVFGAIALVQVSALALGVHWTGLKSNIFPLLLTYALVRWASGREVIIGIVVLYSAVFFTMAVTVEYTWAEYFGASLFLLFPGALGASLRYRDRAERSGREQVRLSEREQLARELHDTVAHHVSAIAIQAQAGRAQAAIRPEAPLETLKIIEEEASRTLTEMRLIVSALREDGRAERSPAATLADIERLGCDDRCSLPVDVKITGLLDDLNATLASTLFRLTQESVTNAVRHAEGAQTVTVRVTGEESHVHLTVKDDGNYIAQRPPAGLGLQGMTERVDLLGGSLQVGPGELRGWIVQARLPKYGVKL